MKCIIAALLLTAVLAWTALAATASAQPADCGPSWAIIHGGGPSPFTLAQDAGQTLTLDADALLSVETRGMPLGSIVYLRFTGLGFNLDRRIGALSDGVVSFRVSDHVQDLRGIYNVALVVQQDSHDLCVNRFVANIQGPAGAVSAAVLSVGSAIFVSRGIDLKMKAQVQRRRKLGWRRFIPVPAWKRMFVSMVLGALLGFAFSFYLQQDGVRPLSLASAIWNAILGGGITFAFGYSLGALRTYLRPPVEDPRLA